LFQTEASTHTQQSYVITRIPWNSLGYACCLNLDLTNAFVARLVSWLVRSQGVCSQVCPSACFQKAFLCDFGRTCSGPSPFLAVSYSAAIAGYNDCNELQMQAFVGTVHAPIILANLTLWTCHKHVRLTFGAVGTSPVHLLVASCRDQDLLLSKSNSNIAGCLLCVKLGCLLKDRDLFEHFGHPLLWLTLTRISACHLWSHHGQSQCL